MKINLLHSFLLLFIFFSTKGIGQDQTDAQSGVKLEIHLFLQGAAGNLSDPLMRDDLRKQGKLPATEPYSGLAKFKQVGGGGETLASSAVLQVEGENAIVDWVFIELRSADDPKKVLATRSALLQRDGDVVDTDGISPLHFLQMEAGNYFVAAGHRNHLSVMSDKPILLSKLPRFIDFRNPDFPTYGKDAQAPIGNRMAMWGGNTNLDNRIIALGPKNDVFYIFSRVVGTEENPGHAKNFICSGYFLEDVNLDGKVIFQGPNSDHTFLLYKILLPWQGNCPNPLVMCMPAEQLP